MARPKSEDKRQAILAAAIEIFAARGLGAATAQIARHAGVSEGTLFNYFSSKDQLLNEVYLLLKEELSRLMLSDYPDSQELRTRAYHIWQCYIGWGVAQPAKRKSMALLGLSDKVGAEVRARAMANFSEINDVVSQIGGSGSLCGQSSDFAGAIMGALAETTMDFIARQPDRAEFYTDLGFNAFWNAITAK